MEVKTMKGKCLSYGTDMGGALWRNRNAIFSLEN